MNVSKLEKIASDPGSVSGEDRRQAFDWADKKRFDSSVSPEYRERASVAFFKIFKWGSEAAKHRPK